MFYLLYTLLGGLCVYFSFTNLLSEKMKFYKYVIIFSYTLLSAYVFYEYFGQYSALFMVVGILILLFIFTTQKWMNLSCALFGYLFTVTFNYLCIWIVQKTLHMDLEQMSTSPFISLSFSTIYFLLCYTSTKLLGWFLNTKLKISTILSDPHLSFAIFISMALLAILFIFNFSYGDHVGYSYGVVAFNGFLFLCLFAAITTLMWFLYRTIEQKQQAKAMLTQYEHLQSYTLELEKLYGSMRCFKHDYVNILSTLSSYIERGDMASLQDFFHAKILPLSHDFSDSDTKIGTLSNIESLQLKSLLSSKLIYSMELGIKTEIEITEPISEIPIDGIDLTRILGIFFDNAIEATQDTVDKKLQLCIFYKDDNLVIILRNTANPPIQPIGTLTSWGVSTKGSERGIGLYNAKNLLDHHQNVLWDMTYEEPFFTQILTMTRQKEVSL